MTGQRGWVTAGEGRQHWRGEWHWSSRSEEPCWIALRLQITSGMNFLFILLMFRDVLRSGKGSAGTAGNPPHH